MKKEEKLKSFWVKVNDPSKDAEASEQLNYMLSKFLTEYKCERISIGTYMPDSEDFEDILNDDKKIDFKKLDNTIRGIHFEKVTEKEWIDKYEKFGLLSNMNTTVGLVEEYDITGSNNDVPDIKIKFSEFDKAWEMFIKD